MASHHAPHHGCPPTPDAVSCCCCYHKTCCHPPPPDPLLHSAASQILHPPPQTHLYSPCHNQPHGDLHSLLQLLETQYYPPPMHRSKEQVFQLRRQPPPEETQPIVSSLLRRIATLESSLLRHRLSANSSVPSWSLRDVAARTIQTHFRAFLVSRSRTLSQLKHLASIKSALNALKASLSGNACDSQALSRKAMGLLLKLDTIQGSDPMIRDGKRAISRELIRLMEFIDGVSSKRNTLSSLARKDLRPAQSGSKSRAFYGGQRVANVDFGDLLGDEREFRGKSRGQVEKTHGFSRVSEMYGEEGIDLENPSIQAGSPHNRIGGLLKRPGGAQAKVKKSVTFAENGKVSRATIVTQEPNSNGEVNVRGFMGDEIELMDNLCRKVEEIGQSEDEEEAHTDEADFPHNSDGEGPRRNLRCEDNHGINWHYQAEDRNCMFSAPLPVKMESRSDLMKKRNAVRIID